MQAAQAAISTSARPAHLAPRAANTGTAAYNTFGLTREVFGYAYAGSLGDPNVGYPSWNFDLLSTVAFFSIGVNYDGVLVADSDWTVWDSSTLTALVTTAHQHGVKVVPTLVPRWRDQVDFCDTMYNGLTTVQQIVNQVKLKGVDGVNIDYEGSNYTCTATAPGFASPIASQTLFTQFVANMRAGLDNYKKGLYLSVASYSGSASANDGFFNIPDLNQYVDSFFVMAYDMDYANQGQPPLQNCSSFCMAPVSPLANYYWNDSISMAQYSADVGPGKVILGQPYYGRVSCVAGPAAHAIATGSVGTPTYLDAAAAISSPDIRPGTYSINRDTSDPGGVDRWDAWYDNAIGCWREMYWSDVITLSNRYDLINQNNLRGAGIWTLQYGGSASELWNAIQSHFVACMNTTLTPNAAPPQLSGTAVQFTAATTACVNPRYQFWMLPPGGSWRIVQPYSTTATYNWNSASYPPGTYRFSVWARDMNSRGPYGSAPNTYDSVGAMDYQLTTAPCTSMTASAAPPSGVIGTTVTISGAATSCPNPSYEFWMQAPGGSWSVIQGYSTNANFVWKTNATAAGTYRFAVWARDASSLGTGGSAPNTYDAASGLPYTLGQPNCSAVSAPANPADTASRGTPVSITAAATGCPTPLYEVWLLPPSGGWTLMQGYSSNPTFSWNTTGLAIGSYRFSFWARDAASPNSYDSLSAFQYSLTTAPCTAMSATPNPASTATIGTTVTITGAATGCPNPSYEFWMLAPGGGWTLAQGYSSNATFTWDTTGKAAGTYRFSVWARDASSSGTSGSAPNSYDSLSAFTYALTSTPCTALSASQNPGSTTTVGTTVTITGAATGCPNALYEFWILAPGGSWTLVKAYSSSATFTWTTTGMAAGTYRFSVWARDVSSSGTSGSPPYTYDSVSGFTYTLT
jgi:hypothetical protein